MHRKLKAGATCYGTAHHDEAKKKPTLVYSICLSPHFKIEMIEMEEKRLGNVKCNAMFTSDGR